MAEPLPTGIAELLPSAMAHVEARLASAQPQDLAGLMQRMWDAGVPQPHEATLREWKRLLSKYPAAVLAQAFDRVVETHRWPDPPKIADVVRFVGDGHGRLLAWKRKLEKAQLRASLDAKAKAADDERARKHAAWLESLSPEQRADLERVRDARERGESVASLIGFGAAQPHDTEAMR